MLPGRLRRSEMMPSEPKGTSFPVEAPVGKFAWPQEVI